MALRRLIESLIRVCSPVLGDYGPTSRDGKAVVALAALVCNGSTKIRMHKLYLHVLGRRLEVRDLCWRDHDIDNVAGGWLALPNLELELAHYLVEFCIVGIAVYPEHLPVIVADLLRDRSRGNEAERGNGDGEKPHGGCG